MHCESSQAAALNATVVGVLQQVVFTACDDSGLPVDHQLPSPTDTSSFSVVLADSFGANQSVRIEYVGAGAYAAAVSVPTHGPFALVLNLEGAAISRLAGLARCPVERVPLPDGRCGCESG
eukprot:1765234-Prymnesium_polylepis.1